MSSPDLVSSTRRLFLYEDWANREVLASLLKAEGPPARAVKLLGHIIGAEEIWIERLTHRGRPANVWPDHSLDECGRRLDALRADWAEFFEALTPDRLAGRETYADTSGRPWTDTVLDILTHLVTHSSYHRGQIALLLGSEGLSSANTDFIFGVRAGAFDGETSA